MPVGILNLPTWRGGLAFARLAAEMADWNLQHAGRRLRGIGHGAGLLPRIADYWALVTEPGLNYLCRGFKQYFAHAIPEVERICADLRKQPLQPRRRM
jgi:hypothetical protein